MNKRDHFAASAMVALVGNAGKSLCGNDKELQRIAVTAYEIADAMLIESDKKADKE